MKLRRILKNFSYTIASNFIALGISTLAVLIVPKFIGIAQYGYWQLYVFYINYVGILHLGWLDGIYLRYGGKEYIELDKKHFYSQFVEFAIFQLAIFALICLLSSIFSDSNNFYIWISTACAMLFINLRQFCLYILQDTNRIKEYAVVNSLDRVLYLIGILLLLVFKMNSFKYYIGVDLIGRAVSMLYAMCMCKEIIFRKFTDFSLTLNDIWINLNVGSKLLVANFASSLIVGIIRYGIKFGWGVKVFGKMSLTLNISNLLMTFISAISLVLYPFLKKIDSSQIKKIYGFLKEMIVIVMLLGVALYYPISILLPLWLPKYKDSLTFMGLLFPMCIYSGQFQLLVSTFMKTLRLEKKLLRVNICTVLFSSIITLINVSIFQNLTLSMISIVASLWLQLNLGQRVLDKELKISNNGSFQWIEDVIVVIFIISNIYFSICVSFTMYLASLVIYIILNWPEIKNGYAQIKRYRKNF